VGYRTIKELNFLFIDKKQDVDWGIDKKQDVDWGK
jgi:hypothetical protein